MKVKIISLLVSIFTIISLFSGLEVYADENIAINVQMGLDGNIQLRKNTPVNVEIKNNGKDIDGDLKIIVPCSDIESIEYEVPANIPKGTLKKFKVVVNIPTVIESISVVLEEDNKIIKTVNHAIVVNDIDNYYIGILTDDKSGLSYWENSLGQNSLFSNNQAIYLNKDNFPNSYEVMDNFLIMVINNFDTNSLSNEQLQALNQWVKKGGILVVGTGISGTNTLKGLTKEFEFVQQGKIYRQDNIKELETITNKPILNKSSFQLMDINIKDSEPIISSYDNGIIYKSSKGQGEIFISAFDLGLEPIVSWTGSQVLWDKIIPKYIGENKLKLFRNTSLKHNQTRSIHRNLSNILENIKAMELPSFSMILIILVAYLIVVGPLNYFILKKKDKREWAWITIPLLAVIFGVGLYASGYYSKGGGKIIANKTSIINLNNSSEFVNALSDYGVYIPKKGEYKVQLPNESLISIYNNSSISYNTIKEFSQLKTIIKIDRGQPSGITFCDDNIWKMKNFYINEPIYDFGNIDTELYYDEMKIRGSISNNTKFPINDLIIYRDGNYQNIGNIAAGETKQVDLFVKNEIVNGGNNHRRYYDMLENLFPIERNKSIFTINSITDKNRENDIKTDLINNIFKNEILDDKFNLDIDDNNSVKIFGFCNSLIGQQVKVNNNNIDERYQSTILFCNADISIDKSKNIYLPVQAEEVSLDDDSVVTIQKNGNIYLIQNYCDFNVDLSIYDNYELRNIQLLIDDMNKAYEVFMFNNENNEFVKVSNNETEEKQIYGIDDKEKYYTLQQNLITINNMDINKCIDDNGILKLRISTVEPTDIKMPKLYFEGRRKND